MKKTRIAILPILLAIATMAFASQAITYDDAWSKAGFNLNQRSGSGVGITFSINEFSLEDVRINGEDMQSIILPNTFLQNEAGAPNLPGNGRYLALPQGAIASLRIVSSRTEAFQNVEMAPAPRIPWDTDEGPLDYTKDLSIYSQDAFYPAKPVQLGEQTMIRGVDAVMVGITPFQYNPVTKELIVYRDIELEVDFIGGNGHFGADNLRSRWWDPILSDTFLNYESLPRMNYNYTNTRDGAEYLIICPDDAVFLAWADSIKVFRTMQGISTVVKTTAEVGGNTPTAIENYINDIMAPGTGWDPAPAAILLLGDHGTTGNTIVSPIYSGFVSDHIYADVNGNMMADVILARMTAQNPIHLETMITKFLNYERIPPTNPDFYDNPVTAMGYQSDRWFQLCSEIINGFWEYGLGKNPVRENDGYTNGQAPPSWSTNQNTQIIIDYFGPDGLGYIPATPSHLTDWGGNATRINNDINSGAFMLQHRDHGGETGWSEPSYHISDLSGLHNEGLVYVFSINCLTGKFNINGECFAEAFHRYTYNGQNAGALGIIAASEVSYSFVNDTFVWGMYDNMWPDFMPEFGTTPDHRGILPAFANAAGKYFLQQSNWPYNPQNKAVTYYLFHHHGDAFSTVYSEMPQNLTVVHEPVLLSGLSFFEVTANEGSLIALSVDGVLIGVGEGTGAPVNITIDPQLPPAIVDIVITKQNFYRYESQIQVIPPGGPYVVFDSYVIDDTATGNSNGVLDYGEQVDLDFSVNNVGSEQATNVVVNISTTDPYVTIFDGTENFGNIPAGTIVTINGAFSFGVDFDIPDGHLITFEVEAIGQDTWISSFSIEAHAPILEFVEFLVDDTASGNGDYLWDPGETVDIIITVENCGTSDAFNVLGELTSTDPYVTLNTTGPQSYGDVSFGITADAPFNATSAINTPEAHLALFNIDFTADNGITGSGSFGTQIGGYLIEEYFDSWLPAGWSTTGGSNWGQGSGSNAGGTSPEADFYWSPSTTAVQRLISMPINTTGSSTLALEFKHSIDHFSGAYDIRLETTSDGNTWNIVQSWPATNLPATTENIIIDNDDVGSSTFQLAFVFDGYSWNINNWYVDDVILGGGQSAILGTVSGIVTDIITSQPIEGADIAGMAVSGPDGSYSFDIAVGIYNFTCTANGYENLTIEDVEVLEDQTTTVDFAMNPMLPPENLTIEIVTFNDVLLNWEAPGSVLDERNDNTKNDQKLSERLTGNSVRKEVATDNTRDLIGYKIYKDGEEIVYIEDPGTLTYTDTGVEPGVHEYGITAIYDGGESVFLTADVEIILPIPQNVTAVFNYPNVLLAWDPISDGRDFVSYSVYRDGVLIAEDITSTMYTDPGLPAGDFIYNVTAMYDGPWESEWSDDHWVTVTESDNILIPVHTELSGNYPNPFNPETTIKFSLKEDSDVSIKIYNIKGSVVRTLVDGKLNKSYHEVIWDGKDNADRTVSSGLYFYKMVSEGNSGRYTSTKKMILLK